MGDFWGNARMGCRVEPAALVRVRRYHRGPARESGRVLSRSPSVTCPVALFTAASTSERIAFHTLNRKTGIGCTGSSSTRRPASRCRADQVKGYRPATGDYVVLEPEEIAAAIPESDKTLAIEAFIACERHRRSLSSTGPITSRRASPRRARAFALLREGMRKKEVAAVARTVLFRRLRDCPRSAPTAKG